MNCTDAGDMNGSDAAAEDFFLVRKNDGRAAEDADTSMGDYPLHRTGRNPRNPSKVEHGSYLSLDAYKKMKAEKLKASRATVKNTLSDYADRVKESAQLYSSMPRGDPGTPTDPKEREVSRARDHSPSSLSKFRRRSTPTKPTKTTLGESRTSRTSSIESTSEEKDNKKFHFHLFGEDRMGRSYEYFSKGKLVTFTVVIVGSFMLISILSTLLIQRPVKFSRVVCKTPLCDRYCAPNQVHRIVKDDHVPPTPYFVECGNPTRCCFWMSQNDVGFPSPYLELKNFALSWFQSDAASNLTRSDSRT